MTKVFVLRHVHEFDDGHEDMKFLGVYSTQDNAEQALETVRDQPGFRDTPEGFSITWSLLDPERPAWEEGYVTYFSDGTYSN